MSTTPSLPSSGSFLLLSTSLPPFLSRSFACAAAMDWSRPRVLFRLTSRPGCKPPPPGSSSRSKPQRRCPLPRHPLPRPLLPLQRRPAPAPPPVRLVHPASGRPNHREPPRRCLQAPPSATSMSRAAGPAVPQRHRAPLRRQIRDPLTRICPFPTLASPSVTRRRSSLPARAPPLLPCFTCCRCFPCRTNKTTMKPPSCVDRSPLECSCGPVKPPLPQAQRAPCRPPSPPSPAGLFCFQPGLGPCSGNVAVVRIRSTTPVHLLHGLVLLPSGISVAGTGYAMILT